MLYCAESVGRGHPDKMADQMADYLLDAYLAVDPMAKVAIEVMIKSNLIVVAGEVASSTTIKIDRCVRRWLRAAGFIDEAFGAKHAVIINKVEEQSEELNHILTNTAAMPAGDQGYQDGFACDETEYLMPAPIDLAHRLIHACHQLSSVDYGCDAKAFVNMGLAPTGGFVLSHLVLSIQHHEHKVLSELREEIMDAVIKPMVPNGYLSQDTIIQINPAGSFIKGGPLADCGVTGRKLMVDTYGGAQCHGGGAFSGKDPSKIDRSGAYFARYLAKNIVASGISKRAQVRLAYAIGQCDPIGIHVDLEGHSAYTNEYVTHMLQQLVSCQPQTMIDRLQLNQVRYQDTAVLGHVGRFASDKPWEALDLVDQMRDYVGK